MRIMRHHRPYERLFLCIFLLLEWCSFSEGQSNNEILFSVVDVSMDLWSVPTLMDQNVIERLTVASQLFFESRVNFYPVTVIDLQAVVGGQQLLISAEESTTFPLSVQLQILVEYSIQPNNLVGQEDESIESRIQNVLLTEKDELVSLLQLVDSSSDDKFFSSVHTITVDYQDLSPENSDGSSDLASINVFGAETTVLVYVLVGVGFCLSMCLLVIILLQSSKKRYDASRRAQPAFSVVSERNSKIQRVHIDCENSMSPSTIYGEDRDNDTIVTRDNLSVISSFKPRVLIAPPEPAAVSNIEEQPVPMKIASNRAEITKSFSTDSTASPSSSDNDVSKHPPTHYPTRPQTYHPTHHTGHPPKCICRSCISKREMAKHSAAASMLISASSGSSTISFSAATTTTTATNTSRKVREANVFLSRRESSMQLPFRLPMYITECPPEHDESMDAQSTEHSKELPLGGAVGDEAGETRMRILMLSPSEDDDYESVAYQCDESMDGMSQEAFEKEDMSIEMHCDDIGSIAGSIPGDV